MDNKVRRNHSGCAGAADCGRAWWVLLAGLLLSCQGGAPAAGTQEPVVGGQETPAGRVTALADRLDAVYADFAGRFGRAGEPAEAAQTLDWLADTYLPMLDELEQAWADCPAALKTRSAGEPQDSGLPGRVDACRLVLHRLLTLLTLDPRGADTAVQAALGRFIARQGIPYPGY